MSEMIFFLLPFFMAAVIAGIAGLAIRSNLRREATRNVTKWATLVVVFGLVFTGLLIALFTQLGSITELGR